MFEFELILLALSIAPVVVVLGYVQWRDKYEKEPWSLLAALFLAGFFAVTILTLLSVGVFQMIVPEPNREGLVEAVWYSFHGAVLTAAVPEEFFKFAFLYLITWKHPAFNEKFDGILYAVTVSLGFACIENILYVLGGGIGVGIGRAFLSVPGHALFGVIMGYYYAWAKFYPDQKTGYLLKSLFGAIAAHGIYNFILFYITTQAEISPVFAIILGGVFFLFVIGLWVLGFRKMGKHVNRSYFKPGNEGNRPV